MVVIRLSRGGAKRRPFYHVVATDSRNARDSGRFIEELGYFNPVAKGSEIRLHLNKERVDYWTNQGAQPSDRVKVLIKEFLSGKKPVKKVKAKKPAAQSGAEQAEGTSE